MSCFFGGFDLVGADGHFDDDIRLFEFSPSFVPRVAVGFGFFDFVLDDTDAVGAIAGRSGRRSLLLDDLGGEEEGFDLAEAFQDKLPTAKEFSGDGRSGVGADGIAFDLLAASAVVVADVDGETCALLDAEGVFDVPFGGAGIVFFGRGEGVVLADLDLDDRIGSPSSGASFAEFGIFKVFGVLFGAEVAFREFKLFPKADVPAFSVGLGWPDHGAFDFDLEESDLGLRDRCQKGREEEDKSKDG